MTCDQRLNHLCMTSIWPPHAGPLETQWNPHSRSERTSWGPFSIPVHEEILIRAEMIQPSFLHSSLWLFLLRELRSSQYVPFLTAVYRNTLVRVHQSHGRCKKWRKFPMGESHGNPPNEEIVSRFSIWLSFFKNLLLVCNPTFGQLQRKWPLTLHSFTKNQTGRDKWSFHSVPMNP